MLHCVPLPPTPASVRTLAWFMEIVAVKLSPSSAATLTGLVVPPMFKGPDEGITMMFYRAVVWELTSIASFFIPTAVLI